MIATDALRISLEKIKETRIKQVDWKKLGFGNFFSDHMFIADYSDGKWKNARIAPYGNFAVSPAMSALHYGQSIFEGMKAFKNEEGQVRFLQGKHDRFQLAETEHHHCNAEE